jgi:excisionase family DNA binding protein
VSLQGRFKKPPAVVQLVNTHGEPRCMNLRDSAKYLGVKLWTVRELVKNHKIAYLKLGRGFQIDRVDLDAYISKNKIGVAA